MNMFMDMLNIFIFFGTDNERILYTQLMNNKLREYCNKYNYIFLDTYNYYSDNRLLNFDKSDGICHISINFFQNYNWII